MLSPGCIAVGAAALHRLISGLVEPVHQVFRQFIRVNVLFRDDPVAHRDTVPVDAASVNTALAS